MMDLHTHQITDGTLPLEGNYIPDASRISKRFFREVPKAACGLATVLCRKRPYFGGG
jgi:hypothetical protein